MTEQLSPDAPRVLSFVRRFGWNVTSFQVLEPGFRYWFDGDEACVAFVDTGGAWVAAGAPLTAPEALGAAAARFVAAAEAAGRRAVFFAVEPRFLAASGLPSLRVGEQPVWDPRSWRDTLAGSRSLREQIRRARAKGVAVRALAPAQIEAPGGPLRRRLATLIDRWSASKPMAPMGFLVGLYPFSLPEERRYFVAERAGEPVGFLAAVPVYSRGGWFCEDLLRDPAAPNGCNELLIHEAMTALSAEGSGYLTLGLAPLAGELPAPLRVARWLGSWLYDFEGLRAFKARLRPARWDPICLAWAPGQGGAPLAVAETLRAFASGGLLRFGLRTLRHLLARLRRRPA